MARVLIDIDKEQTRYILTFCGEVFRQRTVHLEDGAEFYSEEFSEKVQASLGDILAKKLSKEDFADLLITLQELSDNTTVGQINDSIKALTEYEELIKSGSK